MDIRKENTGESFIDLETADEITAESDCFFSFGLSLKPSIFFSFLN